LIKHDVTFSSSKNSEKDVSFSLIIRNVNRAANQHIRMTSGGSCGIMILKMI